MLAMAYGFGCGRHGSWSRTVHGDGACAVLVEMEWKEERRVGLLLSLIAKHCDKTCTYIVSYRIEELVHELHTIFKNYY